MSRVVENSEQVHEDEEYVEVLSNDTEEDTQKAESSEDDESSEETSHQEYEVPEKFKGKSLEDIIASYTNLEREFGRKNNEVGELRKLTDRMLELELTQVERDKEKDSKGRITSNDLYENPEQVLNEAIANHPALKQVTDKLTAAEIQGRKKDFEDIHPDWQDVMSTSDFQEWIVKSNVRLKMFQEADKNFDYETGAELLSLYKEVKGQATKKEEASKEQSASKRKKALKDASVETKSSGAPSSKIYRRSDLINLRIQNPAKFDSMQDELMLAYKEGRVR